MDRAGDEICSCGRDKNHVCVLTRLHVWHGMRVIPHVMGNGLSGNSFPGCPPYELECIRSRNDLDVAPCFTKTADNFDDLVEQLKWVLALYPPATPTMTRGDMTL